MTFRYLCLCAAFITAFGCSAMQTGGGTASGISLHVQPETAAAGQTVTLTLVNEHPPEQLGHNLCTSHLEHRRTDIWEPVASHRVCTMELRILDPGGTARFEFRLPEALATGDYRVVTTVYVLPTDDRVEVTSNLLRIE